MKEYKNYKELFPRSINLVFGNSILNISHGFCEKYPQLHAPHSHAGYEMHVFFGGRGIMHIGEHDISFSKNSIIIVPPSTNHYYTEYDDDDYLDLTVMFMYKKGSSSSTPIKNMYMFLKELMPSPGSYRALESEICSSLAEEIYDIAGNQDIFTYLLLKNYFEGIFINIFSEIYQSKGLLSNNSDQNTKEFNADIYTIRKIESYFGTCTYSENTPTIEGLANYIFTSRRTTQRLLKQIYNKSFSELHTEYRLKRAIKLICETELSIYDIASRVGYNQYKSFYVAFVKQHGISPVEYRKNMNK